ncbi:MAG: SMI1/KNR4 family protein [Chloroflexota bacterium]
MSTSTKKSISKHTNQNVDVLIQSLSEYVQVTSGCPQERIQTFEEMFDVHLPKDYREFLSSYGAVAGNQFSIFGLGNNQTGIQLSDLLLLLRLQYLTFPLNLVPVEDLGNGEMACLDCSSGGSSSSLVLRISLANEKSLADVPILATSFEVYLYNRLSDFKQGINQFKEGLTVLEQRVKEFQRTTDYDHAAGGKLPRNHIWRPYRFCVQDVLLGATVVQHVRGDNYLNVDVFLTEEVPPYEPGSGVRGLLLFLLCEAYKCGGTMEIRFTTNVEGGKVPKKIQDLALRLSVSIPEENLSSGVLTPRDSRSLFLALTPLSSQSLTRIAGLKLSIERCCYVVQKGIWSISEAELILMCATNPDRLFMGGAAAEQRLLYAQDVYFGRLALLGGNLDRALARPKWEPSESNLEVEDDERQIEIEWDTSMIAKQYRCSPSPSEVAKNLVIPWITKDSSVSSEIPFEQSFAVLVRARDFSEMRLFLNQDIQLAQDYGKQLNIPVFILLPYDFYDLDFLTEQEQLEVCLLASQSNVGLLICPETTLSMDTQVQQRLSSSRIIRE